MVSILGHEYFFSETCGPYNPTLLVTPNAAFMYIHGGPITFKRFYEDPGYWCYGAEMDLIKIYREAEFDNNRFVVHETAHAYENATKHWLGSKPGRNGITASLWSRTYAGETNGGFYGGFDEWQFSRQEGPFRQELNPDTGELEYVDGRGEIFADMFIGWVYNQWEVNGNGSGWSTKGQERADYMEENMPEWIFEVINTVRGW